MAKARGFYGLAPRLCRPTASRVVSFNTREVECAALALRTSTASKARSCFYPWERLTTERPNTIELARCYGAILAQASKTGTGRGPFIPMPEGRGLLAPER
jgi:hypothetical protein